LAQFTAEANTEDLETLADMIEVGKLQTHIDKRYSYEQIPEAIAYIEKMRTRGKVVMEWE
jgi:NADPH:quinone reductase-like Zn-dependent oxidoreductase